MYRAVGKNYRKHKLYDKRIFTDTIRRDVIEPLLSQYHDGIISRHEELIHSHYGSVIDLLTYGGESFLTDQNDVTLLINGEQKYPALLQALREAKDTIHMLYYIFDDDEVGREIANILMEKAREGVSVRFVFDDFGSKGIHKHLVQQMQDAGVELYPFFPLKWWSYLSRINNRNHRKIVIVDGLVGFVGGINISNHYDNRHEDTNHMYRRDTHLRIV
ncbi:MAG: hypothetical protein H6766_07440 [Candidatus Peribacteria bacterium]|nr:MAG: hypothetical protein H6766_07440 [Candidatus Peribacteria bacterium]